MVYQSQLMQDLANSHPTTASLASTPSLMSLNPETEAIIQIDADTREITVPDELLNIGVTGDHLAETVYFTISRYFDGEDFSNHNCIIRYINAGNEYGEDKAVDIEIEDDYIKFGWAINNYVTRYSGSVSFTVQFETEGEYQWQTIPAIIKIRAGINVTEAITEKDDILFRTLTNQIQTLNNEVLYLKERDALFSDALERISILEQKVLELESNVVYTLDEV